MTSKLLFLALALAYPVGAQMLPSSPIDLSKRASINGTTPSLAGIACTNSTLAIDSPTLTVDCSSNFVTVPDLRVSTLTVDVNTLKTVDGKVGVGTATPDTKADIVGAAGATTGSAANGILTVKDGDSSTANRLQVGIDASGNTWLEADKPGTGVKNLYINALGGNLGIGTASPCSTCTLHVAGSASFRDTIEAAYIKGIRTAPDYRAVYADDYAQTEYLSLYGSADAWVLSSNKNGAGTRKDIILSATSGDTDFSGAGGIRLVPDGQTEFKGPATFGSSVTTRVALRVEDTSGTGYMDVNTNTGIIQIGQGLGSQIEIGAGGSKPTTFGSSTTVKNIVAATTFTITNLSSPAAADACTAGTITVDTAYIYVCSASGAWKRAALTGGY